MQELLATLFQEVSAECLGSGNEARLREALAQASAYLEAGLAWYRDSAPWSTRYRLAAELERLRPYVDVLWVYLETRNPDVLHTVSDYLSKAIPRLDRQWQIIEQSGPNVVSLRRRRLAVPGQGVLTTRVPPS